MGSYRNEDEALIGLARQLTDAYGEARRREDQDFACDSISEFLSEYRDSAPSEALLALLDLPLTAETYPLVDEVQTTLADRGPGVVQLLLEAVLGEVYDPDGPASERAAETLDLMDRRDAVQGLVEVLCGSAGDDVKDAAVDGLVALGPFAEPALAGALEDPDGGEWAQAALDQIRFEVAHPEALEDYAAGEGETPDDASDLLEPDQSDEEYVDAGDEYDEDGDEDELGDEADEPDLADDDGVEDDSDLEYADDEDAGESSAADEPAPEHPAPSPVGSAGAQTGPEEAAVPDQDQVDDAYDDFLRRYQQESGEGPSAS
jgi:hypothetical protein